MSKLFLTLLAASMLLFAGCAMGGPSQPIFAPQSFRSSLPPAQDYSPPGGFDSTPARPSFFQGSGSRDQGFGPNRGQGSGSS